MHFRQKRCCLQAAFIEERVDPSYHVAPVPVSHGVVPHAAQFGRNAVGAQAHHLTGGGQQHAAPLALEQLDLGALF
jgi:hypothetical protein